MKTKKILALLLSLCLIISLVPTVAMAANDQVANEAGARIVQDSYDNTNNVLTVSVQIKVPEADGIKTAATIISYDSTKLVLLGQDEEEKNEDKVPSTTVSELKENNVVAVKLNTNSKITGTQIYTPYNLQNAKLYGKDGRGGLFVGIGTTGSPNTSQKTTDWLTIYNLRFKVSEGNPATNLDSNSIRIADSVKDKDIAEGAYEASDYYTVSVVTNGSKEYKYGKMSGNTTELTGELYLMNYANITATYDGSTNKPAYTGSQASVPTTTKNIDGTIELAAQTIASETVEYAMTSTSVTTAPTDASAWQTTTSFANLSINETYRFWARVKEDADHQAGTAVYADIKALAKPEPYVKTKPTVEVTYGANPANTSIVGGTVQATSTNETTVQGSWAWDSSVISAGFGDVTYESGNTVTTKKVKAVFTPSDTDAESYAPVTVELDVKVEPKDVTATFEGVKDSYEYTGTEIKPGVTLRDGETIIPTSEYTVSYSSNTGVGTATITVSNKNGGNYNVSGSKTFQITKKAATIKINEITKITYDGATIVAAEASEQGAEDADITYKYTGDASNVTVTYYEYNEKSSMWGVSPMSGIPTSAGKYKIEVSAPEGTNYAATTKETAVFTIDKAELTITAKNKSITYGDAGANDGYTVSGLVGSDASTVVTGEAIYTYTDRSGATYTTTSNVGDYIINLSGLTASNYTIEYKPGTLTVGKKTPTAGDFACSENAKTVTYNGKTQNVADPTTTATGMGKVTVYYEGKDGTTYTKSAIAPKKAGKYNVTFDVDGTGQNYTSATGLAYGTLTIGKLNATSLVAASDGQNQQTTVKNVGTFTEPAFKINAEDKDTVAGTVKYRIEGDSDFSDKLYADVVEKLKAVTTADTTLTFKYTFTPSDTSNYNGLTAEQELKITVKDIEFTGTDGAVTEKASPVYGDTWADILTLNSSKISANVNGKAVTGTYSLNVTGTDKPNAGSQTYKVLFNGELDGQSYTNVEVLTGTVDIAPKALTANDLEYTGDITKVYDCDTSAPAGLAINVKSASKVKSEDVITLTGNWAYDDKNVGTGKTLTYTTSADLAGNYSLASGTTYTVNNASITKKPVTVTGITADARQYDGTTKVTLTGSSASVTDAIGGDNVTVDLTNARGTIKDANVGTGKAVTVEGVELGGADAGNYSLTAQPTGVTVTISKANAPTLQDKTVTIKTGNMEPQTVDLSDIMRGDAGTLTYTVGTKTGDTDIINTGDKVEEGKYKFKLADSVAADKTATVPVKINSENYNEATVNVIVKTTSKEIPVVTVEDITKVYDGTSVATSLIKGTAKKSEDSTEIKGTFEFAGGKTPTNVADSGSYDVKFTPSDGNENTYASVTKAIQVTITPAATTGTPEFGKVTTAGTKLADVTVTTTDKMSQTGTFAWDDVATTEVTQGTSYDWTFTPSNANYATVTGSTVLWARASYGGGSGVAIETVQKPSINSGSNGSYTLSKDGTTATITAKDGYEVDKVTVNGKEVTLKDGKLTGLKTGDKVEVTYKQTTETTDKQISEVKEKVAALSLKARSSKTSKKNIKVVTSLNAEAQAAITDIQNLGYTVKYKFYRSTKKAASYKATITGTSGKYTNTIGKKGTMYYYKARVQVYDANGNLVTQTALKQCKYANRQWTK